MLFSIQIFQLFLFLYNNNYILYLNLLMINSFNFILIYILYPTYTLLYFIPIMINKMRYFIMIFIAYYNNLGFGSDDDIKMSMLSNLYNLILIGLFLLKYLNLYDLLNYG